MRTAKARKTLGWIMPTGALAIFLLAGMGADPAAAKGLLARLGHPRPSAKMVDLQNTLGRILDRTAQFPCGISENSDHRLVQGQSNVARTDNVHARYPSDNEPANEGSHVGNQVGVVCLAEDWGEEYDPTVYADRQLASREDFKDSPFAWLDVENQGSFLVYTPLIDGSESIQDLKKKGALVANEELTQANSALQTIFMQGSNQKALDRQREAIEKLRRQLGEGAPSLPPAGKVFKGS